MAENEKTEEVEKTETAVNEFETLIHDVALESLKIANDALQVRAPIDQGLAMVICSGLGFAQMLKMESKFEAQSARRPEPDFAGMVDRITNVAERLHDAIPPKPESEQIDGDEI